MAITLDEIRALDSGTDSVSAVQSGTWNIGTLTSITNDVNIADGGNSITVDDGGVSLTVDGTVAATQSGAWTIDSITNAVTIQDGGGSITVDGTVGISGSVVVTATDLDVRDLTHVSDSVKIGDGTDFLAINADGSVNVQSVPGGYSSWKVTAETVGTTESQLVATPLANRIGVIVQNLSPNSALYIKEATGVTTANGLKIPAGSSFEYSLDNGASIYAIAASGASNDVRVSEFAA